MRAFLVATLLSFATVASAQRRPANEARLQAFSTAQRALLAPHLERGPALLAKFYDSSSDMPAVTLAAIVEAPAAEVAAVIEAPEGYAGFMPAIDSTEVESRRGSQIAYQWRWQLAIFTLEGHNVMTTYPAHPTRGHRIDVQSRDGDLGTGRFLWRIHPMGDSRCMLVLAARSDMRGANYVAEQLASGGRSVQRSMTIAMSMVMLLGTQREAERRAGHTRATPEEIAPLVRPPIDTERMRPLLEQGDLVFLDIEGERLTRVSGYARSGAPLEQTRAVMNDPEEFGRSLISGSSAHIVETGDDGVVFEWGIPLALVGVEGRMRLQEVDGEVRVDGISGSLRSGQWRFTTHDYPGADTAIFGYGRYDMNETSRLVRRIIGQDADFAHGLSAAVQVMVVRSLRNRAMRQPR